MRKLPLTIAALLYFLETQNNPDEVIVSPRDFSEICAISSSRLDGDTCWLEGIRWRRAKTGTVLDWSDKEIKAGD